MKARTAQVEVCFASKKKRSVSGSRTTLPKEKYGWRRRSGIESNR
jgi:hypothetical protein